MSNLISRRRFVRTVLLSALAGGASGCGTVLHPERRGQDAGPLDWKIVALDALGLVLFFVPGVVAFAVDFSNGTIYLPPSQYGLKPGADAEPALVTVSVPKEDLTRDALAETVSAHMESDVQLVPGEYRTQELESIDDFWSTREKLAAG